VPCAHPHGGGLVVKVLVAPDVAVAVGGSSEPSVVETGVVETGVVGTAVVGSVIGSVVGSVVG
jgi:hypothetical protein